MVINIRSSCTKCVHVAHCFFTSNCTGDYCAIVSCAHNLFYCPAVHTHNKLALWLFLVHKATI